MTPDSADPSHSTGAGPLYRRLLHLCALAVAASVFPLIWMGGLVTSHVAGLSVPDWPNSYGYNMFLFPPSQWLGGIWYEHVHRLLGTLSGFLSVSLVLLAWGPSRTPLRRQFIGLFALAMWLAAGLTLGSQLAVGTGQDVLKSQASHVMVLFASLGLVGTVAWFATQCDDRRWVRWLTIGQLLAICVQGTFGGLRVTEVNIELAMIHACFAQLIFSLTAFTALVMSKWWRTVDSRADAPEAGAGRFAWRLGVLCFVLIFAQLVAGALMRHNHAGLAIPDLPLAFGKLLPPTDAAGLEEANTLRRWTWSMPDVTLTQVWLHFSHRIGAVLVTLGLLAYAALVFWKLRHGRAVMATAAILLGLLTTQFTLGVLTVYWKKPADIASAHVAVGALTMMMTGVAIAITARRYARQRDPIARANEAVGGFPKAHLAHV